MPGIADNALVKAARLIERLGALRPRPRLLPETEAFLRPRSPARCPTRRGCEARVGELEPALAAMVEPMLGDDRLADDDRRASREAERDPGASATSSCDCRLLPGQTPGRGGGRRSAPGSASDGYELEWIEGVGGTRSSSHTPLWEAIEAWVAREEPGAALVPVVLPGFTDSHYLREAFGTVAYGFFPMRTMDARAGRAARPLGRRAHPGRRPRARDALPARRRARHRVCGGYGRGRVTYTRAHGRRTDRLGGMALENGVLVHGPRHWACAVRTDDGELEVASGRKPLRSRRRRGTRSCAAPARLAEVFALLAGRPARAARGAAAVRAARRRRGDGRERRRRPARSARTRLTPARPGDARGACSPSRRPLLALARLDARRLPRRRAHLDRDLRARRAAAARARALRLAPRRPAPRHLGRRQHRRPRRARRTLRLLARLARPSARWPRRSRSSPGWSGTSAIRSRGRSRRPGHELQHRVLTAEPTPEQLEVANAALAECLRLESRCKWPRSRPAPSEEAPPT